MLVLGRGIGERIYIGDVLLKVNGINEDGINAVIAIDGVYKGEFIPYGAPVALCEGVTVYAKAFTPEQVKVAVSAPESVTIKREELIGRGWK